MQEVHIYRGLYGIAYRNMDVMSAYGPPLAIPPGFKAANDNALPEPIVPPTAPSGNRMKIIK